MTENRPRSWYYSITEIVDMGDLTERTIVSDEKLKQSIEKYGVDAVSSTDDRLIHYIGPMMSFSQIDLVMSYKPNFIINGVFYNVFNNTGKHIYILQKTLENDIDFKICTAKVYHGHTMFCNIMVFIERFYSHIPDLMMDVRLKSDHAVREYMLLTNHVKKWISLFDVMKDELDLDNKKRRIY